jgi:Fe-S cluster assembly iron-binding protein IscA
MLEVTEKASGMINKILEKQTGPKTVRILLQGG